MFGPAQTHPVLGLKGTVLFRSALKGTLICTGLSHPTCPQACTTAWGGGKRHFSMEQPTCFIKKPSPFPLNAGVSMEKDSKEAAFYSSSLQWSRTLPHSCGHSGYCRLSLARFSQQRPLPSNVSPENTLHPGSNIGSESSRPSAHSYMLVHSRD